MAEVRGQPLPDRPLVPAGWHRAPIWVSAVPGPMGPGAPMPAATADAGRLATRPAGVRP